MGIDGVAAVDRVEMPRKLGGQLIDANTTGHHLIQAMQLGLSFVALGVQDGTWIQVQSLVQAGNSNAAAPAGSREQVAEEREGVGGGFLRAKGLCCFIAHMDEEQAQSLCACLVQKGVGAMDVVGWHPWGGINLRKHSGGFGAHRDEEIVFLLDFYSCGRGDFVEMPLNMICAEQDWPCGGGPDTFLA